MKSLIASIVMLVGLNAVANTVVYHDYAGALRGIELENACVTATEVQSVKATKNCALLVPVTRQEDGMTVTDWVCKKWEVSKLAYPRAFSRTVCAEYSYEDGNMFCKRSVEQADFLPNTIKISVVTSYGDADNFPGVQKNYTFPSCQ